MMTNIVDVRPQFDPRRPVGPPRLQASDGGPPVPIVYPGLDDTLMSLRAKRSNPRPHSANPMGIAASPSLLAVTALEGEE